MNNRIKTITAIIKKDFVSLLPVVVLCIFVFSIEPVVANMDFELREEIWTTLINNFYWISYGLATFLMIVVLQLDPAASLNHDWLTRPISRVDWLLAKCGFLIAAIALPIVFARFFVYLSMDYSIGLAFRYAMAIENPNALLATPLFFTVGLLTPSLGKGLFASFTVFLIFISPAWSGTRPLFEFLGLDTGADFDNMMWLQSFPLIFAGFSAIACIYWFAYCRRQQVRAYCSTIVCLIVYFYSMYPPAAIYNWDSAIAIHKAIINDDTNSYLEDTVLLDHTYACYPAMMMNTGTTRETQNTQLKQSQWYERSLEEAGPGAIAFATRVKSDSILRDWVTASNTAREFPSDWRVEKFLVRGRFSADSLPTDIRPRRSSVSSNRLYNPLSKMDADFWLVPGNTIDTLAQDPSTRFIIDYDLAVLSPKAFELKTDGQRQKLPMLGSCKAVVNESADTIEVDCIKPGVQPALVSAELVGVSGSRVDSDIWTTFKPDWLESIGRKKYTLEIPWANLVDNSSVLVTAYNLERIIHKQLVSNGVLGDSTTICPLPNAEQFAAIEKSNWSDKSPHEVSSISVEPGVRVEVLDWRSEDQLGKPTLVLLPGFGATAHSYDELGPLLAKHFQVIAMTRRGAGDSSKPKQGFDVARLSQDVLQVMETLAIESPILVGHSIAGEELSYLGANFSERLSGLIYLDAAYDRTSSLKESRKSILPERPSPTPSDVISYETLSQYAQRLGFPKNPPEGEIMASYDFNSGSSKHNGMYLEAIMMGLRSPDYKNIPLPSLGIYAVPSSPASLMEVWFDKNDPQVQEAVTEQYRARKQWQESNIVRFEQDIPNSEVLVLDDADHWLFLSHEQEVLEAIFRFADELPSDQSMPVSPAIVDLIERL